MSDSVRPQRRQPTRLPRPWDSPGKNTGVGCHFLLPCIKVKSESDITQLCPTLSNPMDCSLPGSSVHGIFQARVLELGAIAFSFPKALCHKIESNSDQNLKVMTLGLSFSLKLSPDILTSHHPDAGYSTGITDSSLPASPSP